MAAVALEEDGGLHPASEVALKMLLAGEQASFYSFRMQC